MKLFRRNKPEPVRIWLTDANTGERFQTSASARSAAAVSALETEAVEMARATQAMADANHREHQRLERRIAALVAIKHELEAELDQKAAFTRSLSQAFDQKQAEVDTALAEVKKLDGKLVQVEAENLQVQGELASAREEIAGYRLAVGS